MLEHPSSLPPEPSIPAPSQGGRRGDLLVSFVIPVFNEELTLPALIPALDQIVPSLQHRHEFIFINDGSTDASLDLLRELQQRPDIRVLNLSRNFGHQIAVTAGLDHAEGDAVIIMDADLQDPPRVALDLIREWERGFSVVYAQRISRKDSLMKRATAAAFYKALSVFSEISIPENTGDFRLLSREVVLELRKYREHDRFLRGMAAHVGFSQVAVPFHRDDRIAGSTGYPLSAMLRLSADGLLGFSKVPLQLISRLGFLVSFLSLLGFLYALGVKVFFPEVVVDGWAFIVCAVFLVGGIHSVLLGILGSYIGRIFIEVKQRPLYSLDQARVHSR